MLRDGKYAAWFRTPRGQGTGVVELVEGRITGCDSFFTYGGSYQVDRQCFTAVLTVKRHAEGNPSVFGPDEVEVNLSGMCSGTVATCSGTAREVPEIKFECTLIYSQEGELPVDAKLAVVKLNRDKLPKEFHSRSWSPLTPPKAPVS